MEQKKLVSGIGSTQKTSIYDLLFTIYRRECMRVGIVRRSASRTQSVQVFSYVMPAPHADLKGPKIES